MNGRKIFQATTLTTQFHAFRNAKGTFIRRIVNGENKYTIRRVPSSEVDKVMVEKYDHQKRLEWFLEWFGDNDAHYSTLSLRV